MPGKDRLKEIVQEHVTAANDQAEHLVSIAQQPASYREADISDHAAQAHEAIDRAAEACKVLVREEGRGG